MHALTQEILAALRIPDDQLLDFFVLFSRFEYSLKAAGFRKDPPASPADVSWDKFKVWLDGLPAVETDSAIAAGRYLIDNPPNVLTFRNGSPAWDLPGRSGQSDIRFLTEGVVRARNNLFHGGKWLTAPENPRRNYEVIGAAISVLDALLAMPSSEQ